MSKLKTLLATATVVVGATLSLTLLTSAATVNTASYASNSQKGYYTTKETDGKLKNIAERLPSIPNMLLFRQALAQLQLLEAQITAVITRPLMPTCGQQKNPV